MLKEFKDFIARGNVMDMAVGIIVGAAFTAIVKSLVDDLIQPFIGLFTPNTPRSSLVVFGNLLHFPFRHGRHAGTRVVDAYGSGRLTG